MYVTTRKSRDTTYVYLVEGVWTGTSSKIKVIEKLGQLEDLKKKYNDPNILEVLKEKYRAQGAAAKEKERTEAYAEVIAKIDKVEEEEDSDDDFPLLNYGHAPLDVLWTEDFQMDRKIRNLQNYHTEKECDLNRIISTLTFSKVLAPSSILDTFTEQPSWLGHPLSGVSLNDCYDSLSFLKKNKDSIFKFINKRLDKLQGKPRGQLVFYDVTNTYFETALTDEEKKLFQKDAQEVLEKLVKEAIAKGRVPEDVIDSQGKIQVEKVDIDFLRWLWSQKFEFLRMRGPSKEHRTDLPLISVALVIDEDGLPMDFEVFAGNDSEQASMSKAIKKLKDKYNFENSILTADRGLNSVKNLKMLLSQGFGFLVAQKVTNLGADVESEVLNLDRYRFLDPQDPEKGKFFVYHHYIKSENRRNPKAASVECSLVMTYSEKRRARDLMELKESVKKARENIGKSASPFKTGWRKFLSVNDDAKNATYTDIDNKAIERQKKLAGFAAVVYRDAPRGKDSEYVEPVITGAQITSHYHHLNRIEDCFRIMKTNLGLRPMYVWTSDHIRGHVTLCVLALLLIQWLRLKLKRAGYPMTIDEVLTTLKRARITAMAEPGKPLMFIRTKNYKYTLPAPKEPYFVDEWGVITDKECSLRTHLKPLLETCGLKLPPRICSRIELGRCLRLRFENDEATMVSQLARMFLQGSAEK